MKKRNRRLMAYPPRKPNVLALGGVVLLSVLMASCAEDKDAPTSDANIDSAVCATNAGPFSLVIDNPYLPYEVGAIHVSEGNEADGHFSKHEYQVLNETKNVDGVVTRVVQKTSWDDGMLVGVERTFMAQSPNGTVCCFGQEEDIYENAAIVETDEWVPGEDGAIPVVFMPANPQVGMVFEQFHDEEEIETAEITALDVTATTPAGTFENTMTVLEDGPSIKKYAAGIGEIFDDGVALISY